MLYETEGNNHTDRFNKGPQCNTAIYSKWNGKCLEILLKIREQIDIISCVPYLHMIDNLYDYDERTIGDIPMPKNATT